MKYDLYIEFKVLVNFSKGHLKENLQIFINLLWFPIYRRHNYNTHIE